MDLRLEAEYSKADFLRVVEELKSQVEALRPLPKDVEGRVMQKLRLDWNYHSNAIEGNKLNYGETVAFLMEGITAKGKPLKDHLDIRGHNEAINFLLDLVKDPRPVTEADIRDLHKLILVEPYRSPAQTAEGLPTTKLINLGEYKTSANHVKTSTGETHYYATPKETPAKMQELMEWFNAVKKNDAVSPIVAAAMFHHKFVAIHPFDDGNGRLSRVLMNLILTESGYPPVVIKTEDRQNYYALLSRADAGDNLPFIEYIAERLESSLRLYLKAAMGEDIDEDEDIDKEIALFKMELQSNIDLKERRSNEKIAEISMTVIEPLFRKLDSKAMRFKDLFFEYKSSVQLISMNGWAFDSWDTFKTHTEKNKKDWLLTRQQLDFLFNKFKSSGNNFNVSIGIKISFEEYLYKIINDDLTNIISKPYHESITREEENRIIKVFITDLEKEIRKNIKQSSQES